jgi:hypothetical protein
MFFGVLPDNTKGGGHYAPILFFLLIWGIFANCIVFAYWIFRAYRAATRD